MTLDQYLAATGRTGSDFASAVGLTEASVSRIRKGQQNITRDVMRRIIAASDGQVTAEALVNLGVGGDHVASDTGCSSSQSSGNANQISAPVLA